MKSNTEHKNEEKVRTAYSRADSVRKVLIGMQGQVRGQPLSLALGDYVVYEGERINALPYSWKMPDLKGILCIISAISSDASKYCIEGRNVFVDRASLKFFRDADPDSLTRIIMMLDGEEEPQEEESGEDESDQEVADDSPTPQYKAPPERSIPPLIDGLKQRDPRDHCATQKAIVAHHDETRNKK